MTLCQGPHAYRERSVNYFIWTLRARHGDPGFLLQVGHFAAGCPLAIVGQNRLLPCSERASGVPALLVALRCILLMDSRLCGAAAIPFTQRHGFVAREINGPACTGTGEFVLVCFETSSLETFSSSVCLALHSRLFVDRLDLQRSGKGRQLSQSTWGKKFAANGLLTTGELWLL